MHLAMNGSRGPKAAVYCRFRSEFIISPRPYRYGIIVPNIVSIHPLTLQIQTTEVLFLLELEMDWPLKDPEFFDEDLDNVFVYEPRRSKAIYRFAGDEVRCLHCDKSR